MANKNREILFDITRIGNVVRVTAVDGATGTEVVIQGPANTSMKELQRVAVAKLDYVMKKQQHDKKS